MGASNAITTPPSTSTCHRPGDPTALLVGGSPPIGAAGGAAGYLFAPDRRGDALAFGSADFFVGLLDRQIACDLIRAHHYSQRVAAASILHLGVWLAGELQGVLQYGYAMNPASAGSVVAGTAIDEYLELNRMWLAEAAPRNSESRALAASISLIRRVRPRVKWIQSFADERCGLFGTVYQAAGFTFHGEHRSTFWKLDGEWFHNTHMTVRGKRALGPRPAYLQANRDRAVPHVLRQFRYLRFLQTRFAKGCRHPARPFPKPDYAARPADERGAPACEDGVTPSGRSNPHQNG
ncbi:hypothetical protein [Sphingomonas sp.]|jgi:hypothetical protein|uniref:Mom family adenine methylcarbamoylation protein n=1 Tax=Sphingomonas sp. TaxID=28214 RepID=UPI002ED986A2